MKLIVCGSGWMHVLLRRLDYRSGIGFVVFPVSYFPYLGLGLTKLRCAIVNNYGGLLALRFFIGVTESGMFPGCK